MKPRNFDELSVTYFEPYEKKSIGNWAKQLMQHMPDIHKVGMDKPRESLKRSYIDSGPYYFDWMKKNFYDTEIDLLLMSESCNYLPTFTMHREYFKALASIMFIHCTEMDFPEPIRSNSSLWGELGTMASVDAVHFFSDFSKKITLERAKAYISSELIDEIDMKSIVHPLPIVLSDIPTDVKTCHETTPRIMYNHRLDPDKGYMIFLKAMDAINEKKIPFELYLCGQPSSLKRDPIVQKYLARWGNKVLHYGLVADRARYVEMLTDSHYVVNACEEVMGISMIEAAYAGAWPIVFNAGALPAIFGDRCSLFNTTQELVEVLEKMLTTPGHWTFEAHSRVKNLDWSAQKNKYKELWYGVYERKMRADTLTGALDKVIEKMKEGPLTKRDLLLHTLKWGSYDYWPVYRYRLLTNGVGYGKTTNSYHLEQPSIIYQEQVKQEEDMPLREVDCKNKCGNKVKISERAESGTCNDCVNKGQFTLEHSDLVHQLAQPARYNYKSATSRGERTDFIDTLILEGKSPKEIVEAGKVKFPNEDSGRIRSLIYVRRGALKNKGTWKPAEKKPEEREEAANVNS